MKNHKKIAFYLANKNISKVDLSYPDQGNPGCGGTEYMIASIPFYIKKTCGLDPILFTQVPGAFPVGINAIQTGSLLNSLKRAIELKISFFVYKPSQFNYQEIQDVISTIKDSNLNIIALLQLTPESKILHEIAKNKKFKAIVCVEHEQLDMLQDHPVHQKAIVIPNALSLLPYAQYRPPIHFSEKEKLVVFLGSLVPQKGFGLLAKAWPKVIEKIPEAKLLVIGSGKLYNQNEKLGKWGVAEENFERKAIRPYLSGIDGDPHESVRFLGVLGKEKTSYLAKAMVGIANPIGHTETFCISAIEVQAAGTPVIAGANGGLFDTVQNKKTGYLVKNQKQLVKYIIELLTDGEKNMLLANAAIEFIETNYSFENVAKLWCAFFVALINNQEISPTPPKEKINSFPNLFVRLNKRFISVLGAKILWPTYLDLFDKSEHIKRKIIHITHKY